MALSVGQQFRYWGVGFVALMLVFYFLGSALTPFLVGAGLAYILDPMADKLETWGCSRAAATGIITFLALIAFFLVVLILVPFVLDQAQAFAEAAPGIIEAFRVWLVERFPDAFQEGSAFSDAVGEIRTKIQESGLTVLNTVLSSTLKLFDFVILIVVSPVVAFYLLLDWDNMVAKIDSWIPRDHVDTVRALGRQMDGAMAAFMRGQVTVMGFLGTFYAVGLMLIGLDFGAFVGLFAGLISFIPYVGSIVGGALALGLAIFQFWGDWVWIAAVGAVFAAGQFIEGNILTPKLVGSSVGLHPVWLMFALSAFGVMFGFFGLLIAVPAAAAIGVLARFALREYLNGRLYRGLVGNDLGSETAVPEGKIADSKAADAKTAEAGDAAE